MSFSVVVARNERGRRSGVVNGFLVSKKKNRGAASVGEMKTKIWFYQTSL